MKFRVGDRVKLTLAARSLYGYPRSFRGVVDRSYMEQKYRYFVIIRKDAIKGQKYHFLGVDMKIAT